MPNAPDSRDPHWWSWADIVRKADRLGIPNFQRGAVWDSSNVTKLLESMYEKSPCGSFVLWELGDGDDRHRHGVPLGRAFGSGDSPMWLVDGQQRTRAMLGTYRQTLSSPTVDGWSLVRQADLDALRDIGDPVSGDDDRDDEDDQAFWGVVLPAMRAFEEAGGNYFGNLSESGKVVRGSMFRRITPRAREKRGQASPVGIVPLASLISPSSVFLNARLRESARAALATLGTHDPDLHTLQELLPWGPQFLTGYAYERPAIGRDAASPSLWLDIIDSVNGEMVKQLAGLLDSRWNEVFKAFGEMLHGDRFAAGWLPTVDVSAAIDAYVRINRAGIRVRAEERALALLSRAYPEILDDLAKYIHRKDGVDVDDGRSLLAHESEHHLGFSVWITAVTRYSALALLGTTAVRWMGTSAIDKDSFNYRLDKVGPAEKKAGRQTWARDDYQAPGDIIRECSERATRALLLIDSVLSKELLFDHRMARPSTRALMPMIDLLYRVPASTFKHLEQEAAFRAAMARLLRWNLLMSYMDSAELRELVLDCHGIDEKNAWAAKLPVWPEEDEEWKRQLSLAFERYRSGLVAVWSRELAENARREGRSAPALEGLTDSAKLDALAVDTFASMVSDSHTLQHSAVGWLYALERRRRAREFSWEAQTAGFKRRDGKVGVPPQEVPPGLEAELLRASTAEDAGALYPEKQHIVPFRYASQIADKGGTRATHSRANAIGNLTWLSQRQNGLKALSDRWTVMDIEMDADNLSARGLLATTGTDGGPITALDLYAEIRDIMLDDVWPRDKERAAELFGSFCDARATWMVEQMREWLAEVLSGATDDWPPEQPR